MAFTYDNNKEQIYVRIKKVSNNNNTKNIDYVYTEHKFVPAATQSDPKKTTYVKGQMIRRGTGSFKSSAVKGTEIESAYKDLMSKKEFSNAKRL